MNKFQIFIRQILIYALKASHFTLVLLKRMFDKKTILLVSKEQIKSYSITPASQVGLLLVAFWLGTIFAKSLRYNSAIEEKSVEISDLKKVNQEFENQVESLNSNLQDINQYFKSISGYNNNQDDSDKRIDEKLKDLFGNLNLNSEDKEIATKIADANLVIDDIRNSAVKRISDLEQKLAIADVALVDNKAIIRRGPPKNTDTSQKVVSLNNQDELAAKQGGPFKELGQGLISDGKSKIFNFNQDSSSIKNEIKYLANLERFIHFAPLSAPLKNYYVSSIFGGRSDPFRHVSARHEGMDLVGSNGAKIMSPSAGKIIFAGKFSSYGNAIIIDHGYGFTTRYGHLSQIHVHQGESVKKAQIIATQGSTGRSTGQHLHYEVRYKNVPLNPKKFLQAGQEIFNPNS